MDASITSLLLPDSPVDILCYVDVYIDYFIYLSQGGTAYRRRIHYHIFHTIVRVFRTNAPGKNTRQDPNSIKKLKKGNAAWISFNRVLGWLINTLNLSVLLSPLWMIKVQVVMKEFLMTQ